MTSPALFEGILFDLDGTLLDTIPDLAEASNAMLAALGRPVRPLEDIRRFVGKGIPNLVMRCMTDNSQATQDELIEAEHIFREHYAVINGKHTTFYPAVQETLAALDSRGIPMAVVTNKAEVFTLPLLEQMGIRQHFRAIVGGDSTPHKKPHPAPLEHACSLLGITPSATLMVGDSANDAEGGYAAGCKVALLGYGYSENIPISQIRCDYRLATLADLVTLLGAF